MKYIKDFASFFIISFVFSAQVSAAGFDSDYEVRIGDFNGDGASDFYVYKNPDVILLHGDIITPIVIRPDVGDFILKQNPSNSFDIIGNLSTSEQQLVSLWPSVATTVNVVIEDINLDGYMDLFIKNLSSVISGVSDHVIYSPTSKHNSPVDLTIFDNDVSKFFDEVFAYAIDSEYFNDNATPVFGSQQQSQLLYVPEYCGTASVSEMAGLPEVLPRDRSSEPSLSAEIASLLFNCELGWGPNYNVHYDYVLYRWYETVQVGLDFSAFDSRSIDIANVLDGVFEGIDDILGNSSIELDVIDILEDVLSVEGVFGGVFSAGGISYDDDKGIETGRFRAFMQLALTASSSAPLLPVPTYVNPLPGATINKVDTTLPHYCTVDGRFGTFRPGGHGGVDLGSGPSKTVQIGTDVYAAGSGQLVPGYGKGHGTLAEIYHSGGTYIFRYSHLSAVNPRGRVNGGDVVGKVGKDGNASAACIRTHLHFEVGNKIINNLVDPLSVSPIFTWPLQI